MSYRQYPFGYYFFLEFLLCWGVIGFFILPATYLTTVDGYYHFKIAQLIGEGNIRVDIKWLPFTVLGDKGTDHHWFWHILLTPFTFLDDSFLGLKIAITTTAALVPATLFYVLDRLKVPFAMLFSTLAVVASIQMPARLTMLRTQNLSICLIALSFLLLARQQYLLLSVLAFIFMQSYHFAIVLIPIAIIYSAIIFIENRKIDLRPVVAVVSGLVAGLIINPWFPKNIEYLLFHTLFKTRNLDPASIGTEWLIPSLKFFVFSPMTAHIAMAAGLFVFLHQYSANKELIKFNSVSKLSLAITLLFLYLYKDAARMQEYYAPFAVITAGLLLRDSQFCKNIKRPQKNAVLIIGTIIISTLTYLNLQRDRERLQIRPDLYSKVIEYLDTHAESESIIFNTAWYIFPLALWHSSDFRYVNGLDGHYLAYASPEKFNLWRKLRDLGSEDKMDAVTLIKSDFSSNWVIVSPQSSGLHSNLVRDSRASLRVESAEASLFYLDTEQK